MLLRNAVHGQTQAAKEDCAVYKRGRGVWHPPHVTSNIVLRIGIDVACRSTAFYANFQTTAKREIIDAALEALPLCRTHTCDAFIENGFIISSMC